MELHIDISVKYNQKGDTVLGYVDRGNDINKHALILRKSIKRFIVKKYKSEEVCHEFHAIMIRLLVKNKVNYADRIIVCSDYNFEKVKDCLKLFYKPEQLKKFCSLIEYRREIKNYKFKSYAHNFVKLVKKNVKKGNNIHKRHEILNFSRYVTKKEIMNILKPILKAKIEQIDITTQTPKNLNI